jgi:hypothetical protein
MKFVRILKTVLATIVVCSPFVVHATVVLVDQTPRFILERAEYNARIVNI